MPRLPNTRPQPCAFLISHPSPHPLSTGQPIPEDILLPLHERVKVCAARCAAAINVTSPAMLQLLVDSARNGGCCVAPPPVAPAAAGQTTVNGRGRAADNRLWLQVIADIALTDGQIRTILGMRTEVLRALNRCFAEREALARRLHDEVVGVRVGYTRGCSGATATSEGSAPAVAAAAAPAISEGAVSGGEAQALLTAQVDRMRQSGYLRDVARGSLMVRELLQDLQVCVGVIGWVDLMCRGIKVLDVAACSRFAFCVQIVVAVACSA